MSPLLELCPTTLLISHAPHSTLYAVKCLKAKNRLVAASEGRLLLFCLHFIESLAQRGASSRLLTQDSLAVYLLKFSLYLLVALSASESTEIENTVRASVSVSVTAAGALCLSYVSELELEYK